MRRAIGWVFALLISSSWGCSTERGGDTPERITGRTMGTSFSLQIVGPAPPQSRAALQRDVLERLSTLNEHFSTYQATSELSRINASRSRDWLSVSPLLCEVLEDALSLAAETDGAFDVTLGSLVELWGFGAASPLVASASGRTRRGRAGVERSSAARGRLLETRASQAPCRASDRPVGLRERLRGR